MTTCLLALLFFSQLDLMDQDLSLMLQLLKLNDKIEQFKCSVMVERHNATFCPSLCRDDDVESEWRFQCTMLLASFGWIDIFMTCGCQYKNLWCVYMLNYLTLGVRICWTIWRNAHFWIKTTWKTRSFIQKTCVWCWFCFIREHDFATTCIYM